MHDVCSAAHMRPSDPGACDDPLRSVSSLPRPASLQVLTPGTTHVAVGFLDLGALAAAVQVWPPGHERGKPPLRWVRVGRVP
jgi:hypothetical protein